MEKFKLFHRVYYYETDRMGRVYHSNYFNWMEEARTEFIRSRGINYKKMEEDGYFLPISEIKADFFLPIEYDENVAILVWTEEVTRIKIRFCYEFWNEKMDKNFSDGYSVNVFTDSIGKIKRTPHDLLLKLTVV